MPRRPTGRPPGRPKPEVPSDLRTKPELPDRLWKAIAEEVSFAVDLADPCAPPDAPWPSTASARQVAALAGVTHRAIRQRRKDPLYRAAFNWRFYIALEESLEESDAEKERQRAARGPGQGWWSEESHQRWQKMDEAERQRYLRWWVKRWAARSWIGPVTFDGKLFETPEAYAEYLLAKGYLPADDIDPPVGT